MSVPCNGIWSFIDSQSNARGPPLDSGHDRVPEDRIGVHWKSGDVVETTPGTFEVQEE